MVEILLAYGAVADKPDKNGMTPEDLAELSNYAHITHTIRVWRQMNETPSKPPSDGDAEAGPSGARRSRADSAASSAMSDASDAQQQSRNKGKERAASMVTLASEKGIRLLRNSLENGFRNSGGGTRTSPTTNANTGLLSLTRGDATPTTPPNVITTPATPGAETREPSLDLPSPFGDSAPPDAAATEEAYNSPNQDADNANNPMRSSRRPSLPAIIEKASNSRTAFRTAIRKTEESSPSIAGSPPSSPPSNSGGSFFRGRARDRNFNKHAILGLFRRGQSPPSRSPSPPQRLEPPRVLAAAEADANVRRLKRASMDPELMKMAIDSMELNAQLEAAAVTSAPVSKTRFFEEPQTPIMADRPILTAPSTVERSWDRRPSGRVRGVISPSPLANEWGANEDDEDRDRTVTVRRTRTEVRKQPSHPRRMPSEPVMNGYGPKRRASTMPSEQPTVSNPDTAASSMSSSPFFPPSDAEAADDEREDVIESAMPSIEALAVTRAQAQGSADSSPVASIDVPALTLDAPDDSELTSSTELRELSEMDAETRRLRGESVGSSVTNSSRGIKTPPSVTPPGATKPFVDEVSNDMRSLGFIPSSPSGRANGGGGGGGRARGHSLGSQFPPVPEHEVTDSYDARPPLKMISTHAEARDAMQQTERDVLELAQMPVTEDSYRSLADQLAAYGDTHALAEEFARVESGSQTGSRLSHGSLTSSASGDSSGRHKRRSVSSTTSATRHSRNATSPSLSFTALEGKVPSIHDVYDRRDKAYRDRMSSLASTPIHGMQVRSMATVTRSRTVSGDYVSGTRSRATSGSDNWLTAGPHQKPPHPQRRLTDPSMTAMAPEGNTHMSGQMPMVSELYGSRKLSGSRSALGYRHPSSAPVTAMPSARASPVPGVHRSNSTTMSRSSSLHRPNDRVNSMRYQGLAQARQFAASSAHGSAFASHYGATTADGNESDDSEERRREYTVLTNDWQSERAPSRAETVASSKPMGRSVSVSGHHGGYGHAHSNSVGGTSSSSGRWGQFKGAIGNLNLRR